MADSKFECVVFV